ncbi:hypothetical protein B7764_16540 [Pantoea ananatis]|nr:hypothetical protein B7764_16540 [Pantoea ananatis]
MPRLITPANKRASFAPQVRWPRLITPVTYCSKLPGMTHLAAFLQHECHRLIPQKMRDGKDILNNGLGMIWRMGFQDEVMPR